MGIVKHQSQPHHGFIWEAHVFNQNLDRASMTYDLIALSDRCDDLFGLSAGIEQLELDP